MTIYQPVVSLYCERINEQAIDDGDIEEERRLCYVAMTRAKSELIMTWRRNVPVFTPSGIRTVEKSRSRFLDILAPKKSRPRLKSSTKPSKRGFNHHETISESYSNGRKYSSFDPKKPPRMKVGRKSAFSGTTAVYDTVVNKSPHRFTKHHDSVQRHKSDSKNKRQNLHTPFPIKDHRPITARKAPSGRESRLDLVDSTWFFPVGTLVEHTNHGFGVVQQPLNGEEKEQSVRVRFESGEVLIFPAEGDELRLRL